MHALGFVPLARLGARAHVMVDGAPRPGTVLCLSHWPASPVPPELARDTSTEIALASLADLGERAGAAAVATCDHLDEDGVAALFCVVAPAHAEAHAARLVAAAHTGDFDVVGDREGARVAWALRHLFDPARSVLRAPPTDWPAAALAAGLEELPALLAGLEGFRPWWEEEDAAFGRGAAALAAGAVSIELDAALDLAFVSGPGPAAVDASFARAGRAILPVSRAALHSGTSAVRMLVVAGEQIAYYDRYETWVRFCSRPLPARRDLTGLAAILSAEEPGGIAWRADPPGKLVPSLAPVGGVSGLDPRRVRALVAAHLATAPPAWFPGGAAALSGPAAPTAGTSDRGPTRWRGRRRAAPSA